MNKQHWPRERQSEAIVIEMDRNGSPDRNVSNDKYYRSQLCQEANAFGLRINHFVAVPVTVGNFARNGLVTLTGKKWGKEEEQEDGEGKDDIRCIKMSR